MNRHKKFYAGLNAKDDYDDDDYDYEEDEYNYDEEAYEEETYEEEAVPKQAPAAPALTTVTADAPDYELLRSLLAELHSAWKSSATHHLPLSEAEAVRALRGGNYDVKDSVQHMLDEKNSQKDKSSGAGGVLRVAAVPRPTTPAHDTAADHAEAEVNGATPEANGTHVPNGASKRPTMSRATALAQPDLAIPDCTFVIAGHVDAGKSTTLGHLLLLLGKVSMDEVRKNEKAAKVYNKESFKYAWLLDQSEEERRRGVTIDSGSFCFQTEHRRINILDAPGHKDFVLNMISSATQADAALLVVTAGISDFETGLKHGTKEHLLVLKTLGVGAIVVAVNKMDSVSYSQERYDYVVQELGLLLKQINFKEQCIMGYCPISGMVGTNILSIDAAATPWYHGPSLVDMLDSCPLQSRLLDAPLRLSLQDIDGSRLFCHVESGKVGKGDTIVMMPCDVKVKIKNMEKPTVGGAVPVAFAGETIEILTSSPLTGVYPGCVGCPLSSLIGCSTDFEAHVQTFPSLGKAILPGSSFTMVVHAIRVTVKVFAIISKMDGKGNWSKGMVKCVPANSQALVLLRAEMSLALEPSDECQALGRFVLQQDGDTVAGGLVKKIIRVTY